ncbi:MAG: hypothetical protein KDA33_02780 [Phycisphaerales bacterium]|nr:hypothetical protein [Phycisphaerales bacterium]
MIRSMIRSKRSAGALAAMSLMLTATLGCQLAYLFTPDVTEEVQPEYTIGESSVAVLVWADQSVKDEYPQAQAQICRSLSHHLKEGMPDAVVVSARKVLSLQDEFDATWDQMKTNELCKELDCEYILRVDLETFTTRASSTPHLRKARIDASLNLYKKAEREAIQSVYQDEVRTLYPPESKHGAFDMDERDLMHSAIEFFSIKAARKFYAHEILLEDKRD